jgi:hypothetical protein
MIRQDVRKNLLLFPINEVADNITSDTEWRRVDAPVKFTTKIKYDVVGVDFETVFDKDLSLRKMSNWDYVSSPAFESYLVSLVWYCHEDGSFWVWTGRPEAAPWGDIIDKVFVSHNASFDELVMRRLYKDKIVSHPVPDKWVCSIDLARWFQMKGSLDYVAKQLLGMEMDKSVLKRMAGGTATEEESKNYVYLDSMATCLIWICYYREWPVQEVFISIRQRRANYRGFGYDIELSASGRKQMVGLMLKNLKEIPWGGVKPPTSKKEFNIHVSKGGILPPISVSIDDPETKNWMRMHPKYTPVLNAMNEYSKAQQVHQTLTSLEPKVRSDGTIPFEMRYCKAPHTARFQSAKGVRMQNLDSRSFYDFNLRHTYLPRKGKVFITYDLGQIEPRVLAWAAGDTKFLSECARGISPYEVHANSYMGYVFDSAVKLKKKNPQLYALAKARTLALGYQAWAPRFCEMAEQMAGLRLDPDHKVVQMNNGDFITFDRAKTFLTPKELGEVYVFPSGVESCLDYRRKNTLVTDFWEEQETAIAACVGENYFVPLPAGGNIRYYNVTEEGGHNGKPTMMAWVVKGSQNPKEYKDFYGGKLTENYVQRVSRDVLVDRIRDILVEIPHIDLSWTVHDEVLFECDEDVAEETDKLVRQIFTTSPKWAPDLPLDADGGIQLHYDK